MFEIKNRRLYHAIKNFGKILVFVGIVLFMSIAIVALASLSNSYFNTSAPAYIVAALAGMFWISWSVAKFDVDMEELNKDKVFKALKKDWTDV